ncbi:ImpA family type VI secretion system protein [Parashewanella tropica]|uniref:type VI secretion system protein TssA n=1 Tax=Parashewanella tropica TaxID=2547970 RepID=UPI00105AA08A|nr:type VI secretion system ImpA family N-terminal domain-containing protein [Parashewanella tropica]
MFSEELKDELLANGINQDNFCGVNLREDRASFRKIRNSFNLAQTSLRVLTQNPDESLLDELQQENLTNWEKLSEELIDVFKNQTQDIELIAWALTAQIFITPSLKSLVIALDWFSNLLINHWDEVNPVLSSEKLKSDDKDEQEKAQGTEKIKAFTQLVGDTLESCLFYSPFLTFNLLHELSFFDYKSAINKGEIDQLKETIADKIPQEKEAISEKVNNLSLCIVHIEAISQWVAQKTSQLGIQGTNFSFIKALLSSLLDAFERLTGITPIPNEENSQTHDDENNAPSTSSDTTETVTAQPPKEQEQATTPTPPIQQPQMSASQPLHFEDIANSSDVTREQAFKQLQTLSSYFQKTEPHSPVSYLLDIAINWGKLALPNLLDELMSKPQESLLKTILLKSTNSLQANTATSNTSPPIQQQAQTNNDPVDAPAPEANTTTQQNTKPTTNKPKPKTKVTW